MEPSSPDRDTDIDRDLDVGERVRDRRCLSDDLCLWERPCFLWERVCERSLFFFRREDPFADDERLDECLDERLDECLDERLDEDVFLPGSTSLESFEPPETSELLEGRSLELSEEL